MRHDTVLLFELELVDNADSVDNADFWLNVVFLIVRWNCFSILVIIETFTVFALLATLCRPEIKQS